MDPERDGGCIQDVTREGGGRQVGTYLFRLFTRQPVQDTYLPTYQSENDPPYSSGTMGHHTFSASPSSSSCCQLSRSTLRRLASQIPDGETQEVIHTYRYNKSWGIEKVCRCQPEFSISTTPMADNTQVGTYTDKTLALSHTYVTPSFLPSHDGKIM